MIRNIFALCLCLFALSASAEAQTTSCPNGRCGVAREVRLGPWQANRLHRQAERQSRRDCRNGNCGVYDGPTAIITQPARRCRNCR